MPGKITSVAVILLALAAIIGAGAWMAGRHYQPTIDQLNEALTQCKDTGRQQSSAIASQNAGITALQTLESLRKASADEAQRKAHGAAQDDYGKANAVLSESTTGDACVAASAAFDNELRRERAK
ncbi:hypothetical protein JKX24_16610 [Serratia proteamaculans]|uniref:Uncharacterized protein n=1 Tax=Serratia proteamaculans TaxID=28151 RepID=A0A7U0N3G9_SERPR|nr:hypothetical protein [Serratia proteamaculans]MBO1505240.1 hypothetical protein [Serratia proteamaculans]QQX51824.1 hypothetical protein JKX24_16610 [Serratia proteamaculans]